MTMLEQARRGLASAFDIKFAFNQLDASAMTS